MREPYPNKLLIRVNENISLGRHPTIIQYPTTFIICIVNCEATKLHTPHPL